LKTYNNGISELKKVNIMRRKAIFRNKKKVKFGVGSIPGKPVGGGGEKKNPWEDREECC